MPNAFNFAASPFDCLNEGERRLVRDNVDIAYYAENEAILEAGATPAYLFVVTKGCVTQYEGEEVVATYGPDDCFDGRASWPASRAAASSRPKRCSRTASHARR